MLYWKNSADEVWGLCRVGGRGKDREKEGGREGGRKKGESVCEVRLSTVKGIPGTPYTCFTFSSSFFTAFSSFFSWFFLLYKDTYH